VEKGLTLLLGVVWSSPSCGRCCTVVKRGLKCQKKQRKVVRPSVHSVEAAQHVVASEPRNVPLRLVSGRYLPKILPERLRGGVIFFQFAAE
jgi:hypothetical protein